MTYLVRFHTEAEVEMNDASDYLNRYFRRLAGRSTNKNRPHGNADGRK